MAGEREPGMARDAAGGGPPPARKEGPPAKGEASSGREKAPPEGSPDKRKPGIYAKKLWKGRAGKPPRAARASREMGGGEGPDAGHPAEGQPQGGQTAKGHAPEGQPSDGPAQGGQASRSGTGGLGKKLRQVGHERASGEEGPKAPEGRLREKPGPGAKLRGEGEPARQAEDASGPAKARGGISSGTQEAARSERPGAAGRAAEGASRAAASLALEGTRASIDSGDDDNSGAEALEAGGRTAGAAIRHARYSRKLMEHKNENAPAGEEGTDGPGEPRDGAPDTSNPISKWRQRQDAKRRISAAARAGSPAADAPPPVGEGAAGAARNAGTLAKRGMELAKRHSGGILATACLGILAATICAAFSSCSVMMEGMGQGVIGTSYTAEDADITGAEADYSALESGLRATIDGIEGANPGYDEYRYSLAEIGHNPYELAALLTILFENYARDDVQDALREIFEAQYELSLEESSETRTGTRTVTDPETGESREEEYEYEWRILTITLENVGIDAVARSLGLTEDQLEHYGVLLETRGNRDDLFGDVPFAVPGELSEYNVPGEALSDTRFANMLQEAEKYLGYPYVWGGASPSTSFDCSGFVSWVINHCGNGWNVGRQTANGLVGACDIIPASEAQPGDLVFFQGTYETSGASHVGIYVGGGMMIHCGNPISYASIQTPYWQQHFYCFGRIRD